MRLSHWTLAAAVLLAGGLIASLSGPTALAESKSGEAALQARVGELEELVTEQQKQIKELTSALQQLQRTTDGLVRGAKALGTAAETSRENGFEYAGANPRAKTALIEGLKKFASTVQDTRTDDEKKNK